MREDLALCAQPSERRRVEVTHEWESHFLGPHPKCDVFEEPGRGRRLVAGGAAQGLSVGADVVNCWGQQVIIVTPIGGVEETRMERSSPSGSVDTYDEVRESRHVLS